MELYRKYRPKDLDEIIGQEHVVTVLQRMVEQDKIRHVLLFDGPKGSGKTTLARILRKKLHCSKFDFKEHNCAGKDDRGIGFTSEIERTIGLAPMQGKARIWVLDEAHMLTPAAQQSMLKMLEDTPKHCYFILCTTDPQKIVATIRSRCTTFHLKPLDSDSLDRLINRVCKEEGRKISKAVQEKIIANSDGSARNALVFLDKVLLLDNEEDQLNAIVPTAVATAAIEIARTLMNPRCKWLDMAKVLTATELEDPEGCRRLILSYATKVLLGGGNLAPRAYMIISSFSANWFDCGRAGLVACCWEIVGAK